MHRHGDRQPEVVRKSTVVGERAARSVVIDTSVYNQYIQSVARERSLLIGPLTPAGGPLYLQIVQALEREVSEGRLRGGTALPSFRGLAEDLLVSVITVKRAYEELERKGVIVCRQGLGTFVSTVAPDRTRENKIERAHELFREGAREAGEAGLSRRAISRLAQSVIMEDEEKPVFSGVPTHARKRA